MSHSPRSHSVIYVPGLGDRRIGKQARVVGWWRFQGVAPYIYQMSWADGEAFAAKFERLLSLIDRLHAEGTVVSLIGASAGASVVLQAYAARTSIISGVVCICGKIQNPQTVSHFTYEHNPAFYESMSALPTALAHLGSAERRRILSVHPLSDMSVPPPDTVIEGTVRGTLPAFGHIFGIAYGLTLGSFRLIRFLKQAAKMRTP